MVSLRGCFSASSLNGFPLVNGEFGQDLLLLLITQTFISIVSGRIREIARALGAGSVCYSSVHKQQDGAILNSSAKALSWQLSSSFLFVCACALADTLEFGPGSRRVSS